MRFTNPMGIDYFPMPCIAITMALKLTKKLEQHSFMANLMEDDRVIALKLNCNVLTIFLSFLMKYEMSKTP
jgi:hypothetical protein